MNGIRAVLNKGFIEFVKQHKPDVLCLQEIKAHANQVSIDLSEFALKFQSLNSAQKKGYSGTAIFSTQKPLSVTTGFGDGIDAEGRVLCAEFVTCYVVNVYVPNAQHGLARLDFRLDWDKKLREYIQHLQTKKPVILCGDLNVAHQEIDIKNPESNEKNPGFSPQERSSFDQLLNIGLLDTFRTLHPDTVKYSWWSYMFHAREKNIGWRIDYCLTSATMRKHIYSAFILNEVFGSDHCPVGVELHF